MLRLETINCYNGTTRSYSGKQEQTESGYQCRSWSLHINDNDFSGDFPEDGSVEEAMNYCRDPDSRDELWCYSTNPDIRMESCGIPRCSTPTVLYTSGFDVLRCRPSTVAGCTAEESGFCPEVDDHGNCIPYNMCCMNRGDVFCLTRGGDTQSCGIPTCRDPFSQHTYDHDCYTITVRDRQDPDLPAKATDKQVCESRPERFYIETWSEEYPGCYGCACCQRKVCFDGSTLNYNGSWSRTSSGLLCERWDEFIFYGDENLPINIENYCRDYFETGNIWCFTDVNGTYEGCGLLQCVDVNSTHFQDFGTTFSNDENSTASSVSFTASSVSLNTEQEITTMPSSADTRQSLVILLLGFESIQIIIFM
ncbi:plasminogen-like [Mercenaria mercenaria]|uniref:plasminogen-like n=1 Tax=Mercenaria mercenaria TaxID=6596 RepID=UPI00234F615C|nr:plasminogen-like [Mercenaria mercenaria]